MLIEIKELYPDDSPEWVRFAFIGPRFPVTENPCLGAEGRITVLKSARGKPPLELDGEIYEIAKEDMLSVLDEHNPAAANWFRHKTHILHPDCKTFAVGKKYCAVVEE